MYFHNQDRNIREFWSNSNSRGAEIVPEPTDISGKASAFKTELAAPRDGSGVGSSIEFEGSINQLTEEFGNLNCRLVTYTWRRSQNGYCRDNLRSNLVQARSHTEK